MQTIRRLTNEDFLALAELHAQFYKTAVKPVDAIFATSSLLSDIQNQMDFKAWGLFDGDKLAGFVIGYAISKKVFYFSVIYVINKLNRNLKQLIETCFQDIEKDEYTSWEVDCTNKNITSMMEKYGAAPIYTRYSKTVR